jgi:ankyrin repeat protein
MARRSAAIVSLLVVFGRAVAAPGQCPAAEEAKPSLPLQKLVNAALADRPGALGRLLRTPDLNACSGGASPLTQAAAAGRWPLVQALLERGARIDAPRDAAGMTPLMRAVDELHFDLGLRLLLRGADPFLVTAAEGFGVLHFAAGAERPSDPDQQRWQSELVQMLLARGIDPDQPTHDGTTALQLAASRGNTALVELLLRRGANVNRPGPHGRTALVWAEAKQHAEVVDRLLAAGARR